MPKDRTDKIADVKQRLLVRLRNGFHQPGDRFLSNRAVAELFGISYQTAHRLIAELCLEGHLERRPQSGTYVPGGVQPLVGAQLIFNRRASKAWSFGSKLLSMLTHRLDADHVPWALELVNDDAAAVVDRLPVVWESPATISECVRRQQPAVLVNDRPPVGMGSLFIDSVSTDNFSGGVCAAELLKSRARGRHGYAIVAGPSEDPRSKMRVAGFQSLLDAAVIPAGGWFFDDGYAVAGEAARRGPAGVFCCNDQLADALIHWCRDHQLAQPPVVGFDDAPVAERLNLTTISIPWDELIDGVARLVKRRLAGDRSASSQQIFNPRPVIRSFGLSA